MAESEIKNVYSTEESEEATLNYFNGDELAANVWLSKYKHDNDINPDSMHKRMTDEFYKIESEYILKEKNIDKHNLSEYGKIRSNLNYESIYNLFKDFKYLVPQGSIMATLGTDSIASLSNCWVVPSPLDSYASINKTDGDLIYYYKRRGGCGLSINNLRPNGVSTNNAAKTSTGAVSFMERFSNTTREVAMNGRRGALMIAISINHPDSLEFIKIKSDKTKVTGANISIMLTDEYMNAVSSNKDYFLRFPIDLDVSNIDINQFDFNKLYPLKDGGYVKKIKAKEYWDELISQARDNAEPGLMYWDRVLDYDPSAVYDYYKPIVSNPCGEQFLNANDSCRLMAYNLLSFVDEPYTKNATFNYKKWYEYVYEGTRLGDNLVDLEAEYIKRIIDKIESDPEPIEIKQDELNIWKKSYKKALDGRRVGMGITALGDTIAALGYRYGNQESLDIIDKIFKEKLRAELDSSIDMSITRGSFNYYDNTLEFENDKGLNSFYEMLTNEFPDETKRMMKFGRRNVNWNTVAPTGCLVEETRIKTDRGNISFAELFLYCGYDLNNLRGLKDIWLDVNEDIYVENIHGKKNKISKLYWNGESKTKKVTFDINKTIQSTYIHKYLVKINETKAKWVEVQDLKVGDKVLMKK